MHTRPRPTIRSFGQPGPHRIPGDVSAGQGRIAAVTFNCNERHTPLRAGCRQVESLSHCNLALNRGRGKISRTVCRIPVRAFDYMVKAGQPARQKVFPGRYAMREIGKSHVDSRPPYATRKWSGSSQPGTRNIPCPVRPELLYKSSGPDTASAQRSRRTPCVS